MDLDRIHCTHYGLGLYTQRAKDILMHLFFCNHKFDRDLVRSYVLYDRCGNALKKVAINQGVYDDTYFTVGIGGEVCAVYEFNEFSDFRTHALDSIRSTEKIHADLSGFMKDLHDMLGASSFYYGIAANDEEPFRFNRDEVRAIMYALSTNKSRIDNYKKRNHSAEAVIGKPNADPIQIAMETTVKHEADAIMKDFFSDLLSRSNVRILDGSSKAAERFKQLFDSVKVDSAKEDLEHIIGYISNLSGIKLTIESAYCRVLAFSRGSQEAST